jgi:hypothetical protein
MARSAKRSKSARKLGAMRPLLLAAGLGIYWFVEYQDGGGEADAPMWGYLIMAGARLLTDFVGAWFIVSALRLAFALGRFGLTYVRALWPQESQ